MSKIILPQMARSDKENLLYKVDFKATRIDLKIKQDYRKYFYILYW